jgi:AraC-like DNA-binding protein
MRPATISFRIQVGAVIAQSILSVSQAAAMVGLSTSRLKLLFHKELGTSMRAYELQLACQLLACSTLRVKEAHCHCGIPDVFKFHVPVQSEQEDPQCFPLAQLWEIK